MDNENEELIQDCDCETCPFEGIPYDGSLDRQKVIDALGLVVVDGKLNAVFEEVEG